MAWLNPDIPEERAEIERTGRWEAPTACRADGTVTLPRYGVRWTDPYTPVGVPMADGYWTPWHLAQQELTQLRGIVALATAVVRDPDGEAIVLLEQALIEAGELPGPRLPAQD